MKQEVIKELAARELARRNLLNFVKMKFNRYNKVNFSENWHIQCICEAMMKMDSHMVINMPPSYGKTELVARSFIPWYLGRNPSKKVIYISYGDDLSRKINTQVRSVLKSKFYENIFGKQKLIMENSSELISEQGGGLFCTTMRGVLTGMHADVILIDDPIKASDIYSKRERENVNTIFLESILSRLQDRNARIVCFMQRLHPEDLCKTLIEKVGCVHLKFQAISQEDTNFTIGKKSYSFKKGDALFPEKHTKEELENLSKIIGVEAFSSQYLQDPEVSVADYFNADSFQSSTIIDLLDNEDYIYVDFAESVAAAADRTAYVLVGVGKKYVAKECVCGIWDTETKLQQLVKMMKRHPRAAVKIENASGGATMMHLIKMEMQKYNLSNSIELYNSSRRLNKVAKIKSILPLINSGVLVFDNEGYGIDILKQELESFNPTKYVGNNCSNKDDCIDALSSCILHHRNNDDDYSEILKLFI